jgi:hypothetical protein
MKRRIKGSFNSFTLEKTTVFKEECQEKKRPSNLAVERRYNKALI